MFALMLKSPKWFTEDGARRPLDEVAEEVGPTFSEFAERYQVPSTQLHEVSDPETACSDCRFVIDADRVAAEFQVPLAQCSRYVNFLSGLPGSCLDARLQQDLCGQPGRGFIAADGIKMQLMRDHEPILEQYQISPDINLVDTLQAPACVNCDRCHHDPLRDDSGAWSCDRWREWYYRGLVEAERNVSCVEARLDPNKCGINGECFEPRVEESIVERYLRTGDLGNST